MKKAKELNFSLKDRVTAMLESTDDLVPPKKIAAMVGGGDFKAVGNDFLRLFTQLGGLRPDHAVLDMGCGCGRIAVPLLDFLDTQGSYEGLDIMKVAIDWCQKNIAARDSRFNFKLADVYNQYYNPEGRSTPANYTFPYPNSHFDFIVYTSVFTHLPTKDMGHYLAETARVLKPGGKAFMTFFLINPDSQALIKNGSSSLNFSFPRADYFIADEKKVEETAIAFEESLVVKCIAEAKMHLLSPIHYGSWPGRKHFSSFQDILIAQKYA